MKERSEATVTLLISEWISDYGLMINFIADVC